MMMMGPRRAEHRFGPCGRSLRAARAEQSLVQPTRFILCAAIGAMTTYDYRSAITSREAQSHEPVGERLAAELPRELESKFLSLLKLDMARAKKAASDLWSVSKPPRGEREKVYHAISRLEAQIARWSVTHE